LNGANNLFPYVLISEFYNFDPFLLEYCLKKLELNSIDLLMSLSLIYDLIKSRDVPLSVALSF
jgi:hypothetical protein